MNLDELRDLLILVINRNASTLNASAIEDGPAAVIGLEHEESGELFFLEITQA